MPELLQRGQAVAARKRQNGAAAASGAGAAGDDAGAELPNPLTMRAVGEVFKRRWAVPMTVAVVCLAIHFMGLLDDPNAEPSAPVDHQANFMARMQTPLQHAKYGVAAGAIFGSAMWALVVALSDGAEGTAEAGPAEHWAQNNSMLLAVLVSLGMATFGVCAFTFSAVWDGVSTQMLLRPP